MELKLILWLPEVISLIVFAILITWTVNKFNRHIEIDSQKVLKKSLGIFFGIVLIQFLFTYYGTDYFMDRTRNKRCLIFV